jgi:hypothetical protein
MLWDGTAAAAARQLGLPCNQVQVTWSVSELVMNGFRSTSAFAITSRIAHLSPEKMDHSFSARAAWLWHSMDSGQPRATPLAHPCSADLSRVTVIQLAKVHGGGRRIVCSTWLLPGGPQES